MLPPTSRNHGPELPHELVYHCLCPVIVDKQDVFMLHGGFKEVWTYSAGIWLFDWPSQAWTALPDMADGVAKHACAPFVKNGINMVIIAGGQTRITNIMLKVLQ